MITMKIRASNSATHKFPALLKLKVCQSSHKQEPSLFVNHAFKLKIDYSLFLITQSKGQKKNNANILFLTKIKVWQSDVFLHTLE